MRLGDFVLWLVKRRPELEIYLLRWDHRCHPHAVPRHDDLHSDEMDVARPHPHPPRCCPSDRLLPSSEDRRHRRLLRLLRRHRYDEQSVGHARASRSRRAAAVPGRTALRALARRDDGTAGPRCRGAWRAGESKVGGRGRDGGWSRCRSRPSAGPPASRAISRMCGSRCRGRCRPTASSQPILEIEGVFLALIARARRFIYAESQYFASRRIAEAIAHRLEETDGPEVVLVNPVSSHGWLEPIAMDTARARLVRSAAQARPAPAPAPLSSRDGGRRGDLCPCQADGRGRRGAACRIVEHEQPFDAARYRVRCDDRRRDSKAMGRRPKALRASVQACWPNISVSRRSGSPTSSRRRGSLIETVESLRSDGRSLHPIRCPNLHEVEKWLADNEVLDPDGPAEMFERPDAGQAVAWPAPTLCRPATRPCSGSQVYLSGRYRGREAHGQMRSRSPDPEM